MSLDCISAISFGGTGWLAFAFCASEILITVAAGEHHTGRQHDRGEQRTRQATIDQGKLQPKWDAEPN